MGNNLRESVIAIAVTVLLIIACYSTVLVLDPYLNVRDQPRQESTASTRQVDPNDFLDIAIFCAPITMLTN
jgi:hypothetical protein